MDILLTDIVLTRNGLCMRPSAGNRLGVGSQRDGNLLDMYDFTVHADLKVDLIVHHPPKNLHCSTLI